MKEEEVGVEDTFCNNVIVIGLSLLGQTTRSGTSRRRRKLPSLSSTKFFLFYVLMSTTCNVVSQRSERTTFSRKERMREREGRPPSCAALRDIDLPTIAAVQDSGQHWCLHERTAETSTHDTNDCLKVKSFLVEGKSVEGEDDDVNNKNVVQVRKESDI